uniref:MCF.2 cell line derived transforming sequence n=1 Tax=Myotis myotis TaxID=51298 RepID=A0A7J7YEU5_MYOMY|nr:MCF.2 cell line derived transforming sequence [Myotis myotis]
MAEATPPRGKMRFRRNAASFPGNLHLVLVLRPTSFLQRTFTDIGFRFSQEDFMLKLPAIENFALTVKDMAQMLQSFGTELAETDLPEDIPSIEGILAIRAEKYHLLKNDITAVTKEGKILLTNLEVPDPEEAISSRFEHHEQISGDWQTVNKLLTQVHDMEIAFDEFWEKHQLKMEQYLQLWKFEQDFQELVREVELLLNQQAELADVTGNIAHIKQKIKHLENLDENSQIQIQTVQLKLESIRTVFENQQAGFKNLKYEHVRPIQFEVPASNKAIIPKAPFFSPKPGKKTWKQNQSNLKIEVVHDCLEKRSSGPSSSLSNNNTLDVLKNHVLNELIQTEKIYVRELFTVLLGYKAEMDNPEMFDLMPPLLRNKKDILFGNMAEIYEFHSNLFMSSLENCIDAPERVGLCFLERKTDFQMYAKYCQNKPSSEAIWKKYSECAFFQECQRKLKHRLGLDSYLLKPVQRLTKYQLLLKELLKYSKDCEGSEQLKVALDTMLDLLKSVNDSMHQIAINGYVGNLNELGKMIMQGAFSVWTGHKKGATKMKDFARFKPMQRHLFLYEKAIVFCKRRVESGQGSDRYPSYSFKRSLKMDEVGITEYVKGDNRKFEIWYAGKEEIYIVQASNIDVKMIWLKEIRNILLKQQELLTVKQQQQRNQLTEQDQLSSQQNDERQQQAFIVPEITKSEHTSTVVGVHEATSTVQAEANTVWTEEISEGPESWSNNYFSSSYVDNGEERTLLFMV